MIKIYIIHYKNNEPIQEIKIVKEELNGEIIKREEIVFKENIVSLQYKVYSEEDKNKWFDIIQKSYGKWGEVTVEEVNTPQPKSLEDIVKEQQEINKILIAQILKQNGVVAND